MARYDRIVHLPGLVGPVEVRITEDGPGPTYEPYRVPPNVAPGERVTFDDPITGKREKGYLQSLIQPDGTAMVVTRFHEVLRVERVLRAGSTPPPPLDKH